MKKIFVSKRMPICVLIIFCLISSFVPARAEEPEESYVCTDFSCVYQRIRVNGKTVRESGGRYVLTDEVALDNSDRFLPRYMGDGSYAFENRETENRIAEAEIGSPLPAGLYNIRKSLTGDPNDFKGLDDNTQHWIVEEISENQFYMKSFDDGVYAGVNENNELAAVEFENRAVFIFEPLYSESPMYLLSKNAAYAKLTDNQRERLEAVYGSVAGDVFERNGPYLNEPKSTPRARIDAIYEDIKAENMDETICYNKLTWNLKPVNAWVTDQSLGGYNVSLNLPGSEGVTFTLKPVDSPWTDSENTNTVPYKIRLYNKDGVEEQIISIKVQDNTVGRKNAQTFAEVLRNIPYSYRKHIKYATSIKSTRKQFTANKDTLNIELVSTPTVVSMLESVIHELGHSQDRMASGGYGHWSSQSEWPTAHSDDIFAPSSYGAEGGSEDFAEFCRFYFTGYTKQDWRRAIMILYPNRYREFKKMRMEFIDGLSLWDDSEVEYEPTATPTPEPTATPTPEPTATPTAEPTATPTAEPTATPTAEPTATPTEEPTATPTAEPTATPTPEPTATPTEEPTATPTAEPTAAPGEIIVPLGQYESKISIYKTIKDNKAAFTITCKDGFEPPVLDVILAEYAENGTLKRAAFDKAVFIDGTAEFSVDLPKTGKYKIMIWDKSLEPVINAVTNPK